MDGRGEDDRRMHEGDKPGLAPERGHERHEDTVAEGDNIGREEAEAGGSGGADSVTDREQPSALGGDVATRSGTAPTPEEERSS